MKSRIFFVIISALLLLGLCLPSGPARAQDPEPTEYPTARPSRSPQEATPPSGEPAEIERPIIVIESYYLDQDTVAPGQSFKLFLSVRNVGKQNAHNLIYTFSGTDFLPKETGGVYAKSDLGQNDPDEFNQPLTATTELWGKTNGTVTVQLSYNGEGGEVYNESFLITIPVLGWSGVVSSPTPTPTVTSMPRAQLGITGYRTNIDPLQPGSIFTLDMDVMNLGNGDARGVSMILGGGSAGSLNPDGTPQPGGVSGGSADLSVFAPIESSNVQFLGDVATGGSTSTSQKLIVNTNANPGAYALKVSFAYTDAKGSRQIDDQVITMLIFQLPQIEVNYYRDPGPIMAGQPNMLPIQVVNLGRKVTVLGNMTVTAENAELQNNTTLVGTLDAGGYFPLDVMYTPQAAGPAQITITINYTDDFNQARTITQTMNIEVMEGMGGMPGEGMPGGMPGEGVGPGMDPGLGPDGMPVDGVAVEETLWQKVARFFKGLFGLDSAPPSNQPMPGEMPPGGMPEGEPMPVKPLG